MELNNFITVTIDWHLVACIAHCTSSIHFLTKILVSEWHQYIKHLTLHWQVLPPPWSATLSWWWGLCTDDPDDF